MLKKVADIPEVPYGFRHKGKVYLCEPTHQEIQFAVDNGQLENRGYQTHDDDLMREWEEGLLFEMEEESRSLQEFIDRQRSYHAKRIAHFVVHGWTDPIVLDKDGWIAPVKGCYLHGQGRSRGHNFRNRLKMTSPQRLESMYQLKQASIDELKKSLLQQTFSQQL